MERRKTFIRSLLLAVLVTVSSSIMAQFSQLGEVLSAGEDDAEKIFKAYLSPYANGVGAGLSTGWYNTAKPHKLGGFDVTVSFNVAIIPSAGQSYDANELNLGEASGLNVDVSGTSSPTAAGKKNSGQQLTYSQNILGNDVQVAQLTLPKGTGFPYTPVPMVQAGVGLMKESELNFRYSPNIEWGNGSKVGLWGIGLKHGIKQWIPALKRLPVFDLTIQGGYTRLKSTSDLNFQATFYDGYADIVVDNPTYYSNQELLLDVSNFTANLIVSGDFKIICLYGGVGISSTKADLSLKGNYPFPEIQGTQVVVIEETAQQDPINTEIKNNDGSATKPRFNAGFRLKFAVVTLNFDYTYANYSVASAGLGISFR